MSIEMICGVIKEANSYVTICDYCGDTLPSEYEFYDAVDAKKRAGWKSVKDKFGDWTDACPDCAAKFHTPPTSAANGFAGVGKG